MRNVILRTGSTGPLVRDLQSMLNRRLNPSPNLKLNGFFSDQTEQALRAFQNCLWLDPDGVAEQSTLDGLYETEIERPILHHVPYVGHLTKDLRWAAATAMLTQNSLESVRRLTPASLLDSAGALMTPANRDERVASHGTFARAHKLIYLAPQTWSSLTLVNLLRNGPLMVEFVHPTDDMRRDSGLGKFLVISGARGSHDADGRTTTLRILNPDNSQGRGIQSMLYANMLRRTSFVPFGIFTR